MVEKGKWEEGEEGRVREGTDGGMVVGDRHPVSPAVFL